jgi:TPR repeat protein
MSRFTIRILIAGSLALASWCVRADIQSAQTAYRQGDYDAAVNEFRRLADQGDAAAQAMLGFMYTRGLGVGRDYSEARRWLESAARQGNAEGEARLGFAYYYGRGVSQDYTEAMKWIKKAADEGDPYGYYAIAILHAEGKAVSLDYGQALKYFRMAAEKENAPGEAGLAVTYESGRGVPVDYDQAEKWFRRAAEQGDATGMWGLARLYHEGHGVPKDFSKAADWLKRAVQQNYPPAQYALAYVCARGEGVPLDFAEAKRLMDLAADAGYEPAKKDTPTLAKWMAENPGRVKVAASGGGMTIRVIEWKQTPYTVQTGGNVNTNCNIYGAGNSISMNCNSTTQSYGWNHVLNAMLVVASDNTAHIIACDAAWRWSKCRGLRAGETFQAHWAPKGLAVTYTTPKGKVEEGTYTIVQSRKLE